jgi:hypothetical protein
MASGHMNRVKRPDTWLHRPMLQNVKKALANPEPSTHDPICDIAILKARPPHFHSTAFGRRPQHVQHMQHTVSEILPKNPDHNSSRPRDLALSDPSKMLPEAISAAFGPRRRR